jgi:hypothetical protein
MAAKTKAELSDDVQRTLGLVAATETPVAADSSYIEDQYDHKLAELRDQGLAYWPNTSRTTAEIPSSIYGALVDIMCDDVASAFGAKSPTTFDAYGRQTSCGTAGLRTLRMHMMKRPSGEPTKATYF